MVVDFNRTLPSFIPVTAHIFGQKTNSRIKPNSRKSKYNKNVFPTQDGPTSMEKSSGSFTSEKPNNHNKLIKFIQNLLVLMDDLLTVLASLLYFFALDKRPREQKIKNSGFRNNKDH